MHASESTEMKFFLFIFVLSTNFFTFVFFSVMLGFELHRRWNIRIVARSRAANITFECEVHFSTPLYFSVIMSSSLFYLVMFIDLCICVADNTNEAGYVCWVGGWSEFTWSGHDQQTRPRHDRGGHPSTYYLYLALSTNYFWDDCKWCANN